MNKGICDTLTDTTIECYVHVFSPNWRWAAMRKLLVIISVLCVSGCAPSFYSGKFAVVESDTNIQIIQREFSYGNCYQLLSRVPTVYALTRQNYKVFVAHGNRYWPELYFSVTSQGNEELELEGKNIKPVTYKDGADHKRLESERKLMLRYATGKLSEADNPITLVIKDSGGNVLGHESISFSVKEVNCSGWDAI